MPNHANAYNQGHLLNANLGGPGGGASNVVAGTAATNSAMRPTESAAKAALGGAGAGGYSMGNDVSFGSGGFGAGGFGGGHTAAHEAAHIVQQSAGVAIQPGDFTK